jgi:hypothetical protein
MCASIGMTISPEGTTNSASASFRFRGKRLHHIVAHHLGQGRAFHLDADELLYRDAAVAKELGELGLVAKDERQTSPATPRASLGH